MSDHSSKDNQTIESPESVEKKDINTAPKPENQTIEQNEQTDNVTCQNNIRAYEFGREMQTWVMLRAAGLTLQDAIVEYADGLGIDPPYDANDPCVLQGYNDAMNNVESPYNKEGKSWTSF